MNLGIEQAWYRTVRRWSVIGHPFERAFLVFKVGQILILTSERKSIFGTTCLISKLNLRSVYMSDQKMQFPNVI
jgi:hypothetical protein